MLLDELDDLRAVTGHPVYVDDGRATREVVPKTLPNEMRSLLGESFTLYGETDKVCETTVNSTFVQVAAEPHFGTVQAWNGEAGRPEVSPNHRALDLWKMTERGGRFLAANLESKDECAGAVWARATARPSPELYTRRAASGR